KIPPLYINCKLLFLKWVDAWLIPKRRFLETISKYHREVLRAVKKPYDLFVTWYAIPDQACHHFFQTLHSWEAFKTACFWYDLAFKYARELVEASKPKYFLLVSDHSFPSDFEKYHIQGTVQHVHLRDATAVTNGKWVPEKPTQVYKWVLEHVRETK
ncbi:MAG: hypothetical protein DRO23_10075, partial [Thermoprotei archaeon]